MKTIHFESDNDRITRLTETFSLVIKQEPKKCTIKESKILDCSECGVILKNWKEMEDHIENYHKVKKEAETKPE